MVRERASQAGAADKKMGLGFWGVEDQNFNHVFTQKKNQTSFCNPSTMSITACTFRGRPAWTLTGHTLSATVTATGGHLAALWSTSDDTQLSPLWQPQWPSGDPATAAATGTWGSGEHAVEAPLLASICGR